MIDTDKYEGHTEGPWRAVTHEDKEEWGDGAPEVEGLVLIKSPNPCPLTVAVCDNRWQMDDNGLEERLQHSTTGATAREMFNANEQLIADAPLLLEEIKRLRRAFRIATAHIGFGNHLGHAELRRALNSMGIDYNSLPWADEEWEEPLPTFGGVVHYD